MSRHNGEMGRVLFLASLAAAVSCVHPSPAPYIPPPPPPVECAAHWARNAQGRQVLDVVCQGGATLADRWNAALYRAAIFGPHVSSDEFHLEKNERGPNYQHLVANFLSRETATGAGYLVARILPADVLDRARDQVISDQCRQVVGDPKADPSFRSSCMQWIATQEQIAAMRQQREMDAYQRDQDRTQLQQLQSQRLEQERDIERRRAIRDSFRSTTTRCEPTFGGGVTCRESAF